LSEASFSTFRYKPFDFSKKNAALTFCFFSVKGKEKAFALKAKSIWNQAKRKSIWNETKRIIKNK